ncbi:hypothetical protein FY134_07080 [Agrobacterium fabrum]|uniref:hypothetical protein n=1 Tax=Agrobacterium fabrum TaxID=1176649 RepID=UPI0013A6E81C|nr:hypothetical protein [Agrobacterium fabrum]UXT57426.1 hypothetical protein FY134_07080 [Agrobacterium fabrum]
MDDVDDEFDFWEPKEKSPHVVLAAIRLGVLRRFRDDAKDLEATGFRERELTLPEVFRRLPDTNITDTHLYRFPANPYGISGVDKAPPPLTNAVISFVQGTYQPIFKSMTTRALAEMELYVDGKGASEPETLLSFRNHYGGIVDLLTYLPFGSRTVDSQAIVCHYHFWNAYIYGRLHRGDDSKSVAKERANLKSAAREQLATLQKMEIPTRSPLATLFHFQNLTNEMDILAELASLGAVKPSVIKERAEQAKYFEKVLWFNQLFPWRIEEPTQALIIAAHTGNDPQLLSQFGSLALKAVAVALHCALNKGTFNRSHPVITYRAPLFEDEKPLKDQKILKDYLEKTHPVLIKELNLREIFKKPASTRSAAAR